MTAASANAETYLTEINEINDAIKRKIAQGEYFLRWDLSLKQLHYLQSEGFICTLVPSYSTYYHISWEQNK